MDVPQKIKHRTTTCSSNPTSGCISTGNEKGYWENIYSPMFISALFTIASIHIKYYCVMRKKEILPFAKNMDALWGHYAKWDAIKRKTYTVWYLLHVKFKKNILLPGAVWVGVGKWDRGCLNVHICTMWCVHNIQMLA